jgi:PREDICTED: similar to RNA exonuclease 1 homolog (elongin A-binding protein 1) (eloA-BP1) (transcription elongation factor B polypeptide 3-binding protein 1)
MPYLIQYNSQPRFKLLNSKNPNGHHKKQRIINSPYDLTEYEMYQLLRPYTLSSRQLAELDYPLMRDHHYGTVYISSQRNRKQAQSDKHSCVRCYQYFEVDKRGIPTNEYPCTYHPGRLWTKNSE